MSTRRTPLATRLGLLGTLAITAAGLAGFAAGFGGPRAYLALFAVLFAVRVGGQVVARARAPAWLPPSAEWNLLPYRILFPVQLVLLAVMAVLVVDAPAAGGLAVGLACVYWLGMAARYGVRMARRPDERWFGGAIPIVFHCVLAAFLFVLGGGSA